MPDLRNSKVFDLIHELKKHKCKLTICDELADPSQVYKMGFKLNNIQDIASQDAIIIAVAHNSFLKFDKDDFNVMLNRNGVLIDVRSIFNKNIFLDDTKIYWSL